MLPPNEHKDCYASTTQREILVGLLRNGVITDDFFLTGGTALSVFYLHHRRSNDLDLFTLHECDLAELDFTIKTTWPGDYVRIKSSSSFLSLLIKDVKIDFVIDRLSLPEVRQRVALDSPLQLCLDTPNNIASNKLSALASRVEPKDFVDFYALCNALKLTSFEPLLADARKKDAIFDDPPTAAYQIEQGFQFLHDNTAVMPELLVRIDEKRFGEFYEDLIGWLYGRAAGKG